MIPEQASFLRPPHTSRHHRSPRGNLEDRPHHHVPDHEQPPNIVGKIIVIAGGPAAGGRTTAGRHEYAELILFLETPSKKAWMDSLKVPHDDALVIRLIISNYNVRRILVDTGSSNRSMAKLIFMLRSDTCSSINGNIDLLITFGTYPLQRTVMMTFVVVDVPFAYSAIIGIASLNDLGVVVSTPHLKMKFPSRRVPFGLKNAGATYQRLANKLFQKQIKRNVEVYVDDMLVKSLKAQWHIDDLRETFNVLQQYRMKLNPTKCAFGVTSGKFLGFVVNQRGIEANPERTQAILNKEPPSKEFEWTLSCLEAFDSLKQYLQTPPVLTKPELGEDLFLYMALRSTTVSAVLVPQEGKQEHLVYYVSRILYGAEVQPCPAIESHVLADFIVEFTSPPSNLLSEGNVATEAGPLPEDDHHAKVSPPLEAGRQTETGICPWVLHVEGSTSEGGCGAGIVLTRPDKFLAEYALRLDFKASNNEAEYEALLAGLTLDMELGTDKLKVHNDSQLVVGQVNGFYIVKEERMLRYLEKVREKLAGLKEVEIVQVLRGMNTRADALCKMASEETFDFGSVYKEILLRPSIEEKQLMEIQEGPNWMDLIVQYLKDGILPSDKLETRRLVVSPKVLVTDNRTQFASAEFCSFCDKLSIEQRFALVGHPHANGQVEVMNIILLQSLKKRLEKAGNSWIDALSNVLWAYRTTPWVTTGQSSFSLTFSVEAVIPVEVGIPSFRVENFAEQEILSFLGIALILIRRKENRFDFGLQLIKKELLGTTTQEQKIGQFGLRI
ncbi:uncharacterized protein LOC143883069 [Tasmannia lanceolata]|uniref:uncharacterized protein LOC143883069 n=1 Tax=Tasmannia lanceolata TaxID=3420 RepID=UPI0040649B2E